MDFDFWFGNYAERTPFEKWASGYGVSPVAISSGREPLHGIADAVDW